MKLRLLLLTLLSATLFVNGQTLQNGTVLQTGQTGQAGGIIYSINTSTGLVKEVVPYSIAYTTYSGAVSAVQNLSLNG